MSGRIVVFTWALVLAYWLARHAPFHSLVLRRFLAVVAGLMLLVIASWLAGIAAVWGSGWRSGLLTDFPLDAITVGLALGYMIGDSARPQAVAESGAEKSESLVERVFAFFRGLAPAVGLAVLVIAALVDPSTWKSAAERLQGVKAGSIEFTLAAVRSVDLSQDIRRAAAPRGTETAGSSGGIERIGFVPVRLSMLQAYTLPPKLESKPKRRTLRSGSPEDLDALILASTQDATDDQNSSHVRQIERDRAIASKFAPSQSWFIQASASPADDEARLIAEQQETLLAGLAPHVRCLTAFVTLTQNRRLIEYQNFKIVRDLFILAHLWSKAEQLSVLNELQPLTAPINVPESTDAALEAAIAKAGAAYGRLAMNSAQTTGVAATPGIAAPDETVVALLQDLAYRVQDFDKWASSFLLSWHQMSSDPKLSKLVNLCSSPVDGIAGSRLREQARDIAQQGLANTLKGNGYTPYLSIVAAEGLSAMGDHASAIELLVQWLEGANRIAARQPPRNDQAKRMMDWYRLQVSDTILTLQRLSEGADVSIPQQVDELRDMAARTFRPVLTAVGETQDVTTWRTDAASACMSQEHRWKQNIILSYATWVKQYLDRLLERSQEASTDDGRFADLLRDLDVWCFPVTLERPAPNRARYQHAEQHLQFIVTATAIYTEILSRKTGEATTEAHWRRQRARALADLQRAMADLERVKNEADPISEIRLMIYGNSGSDLAANASKLEQKLQSLPYRS